MPIRPFDDAQNFKVSYSARVDRGADALQNLQQMISTQHRQRFIKKVFAGNVEEFERFIADLNTVADWVEAHQVMKNYFNTHGINPYQEEAICLTDIAYKRYFPLDAYIQPQF